MDLFKNNKLCKCVITEILCSRQCLPQCMIASFNIDVGKNFPARIGAAEECEILIEYLVEKVSVSSVVIENRMIIEIFIRQALHPLPIGKQLQHTVMVLP